MTPTRLRLISLLALAIPLVMIAFAGSGGVAFRTLALAAAVAGLSLLLAGPVFRVVLSVLIALLGACVIVLAVASPERGPLAGLGVAGGVTLILVALGIAVTARLWPSSGSRYSRTRLEGDPASDWDALSSGDDPTDPAR